MLAQIQALSSGQLALLFGGIGLFAAISLFAIWDAFKRDFGSTTTKMAWIQVSVMVPFLGGLAYLVFGRKMGRKL